MLHRLAIHKLLLLILQQSQLTQQSGQHGLVNAIGIYSRRTIVQAQWLRNKLELLHKVLPFSDTKEVEVLCLAELPKRARGELPLLTLKVVPEIHQG